MHTSTGSFTTGQLAKSAAQILGVEAEHRALGRDVAGATVPNNRIFESAQFACVGTGSSSAGDGTAVGALLPFVTGGAGFEGPFALPDEAAIRAASTEAVIGSLENDWPGSLATA